MIGRTFPRTDPTRAGCMTLNRWTRPRMSAAPPPLPDEACAGEVESNVMQFPARGQGDIAPARTSKWFCAADLEGLQVPDREWLVPDLIPTRTVTLLYGDGGTGKSLLALQLAVAVALGQV
jgi:hypothetical protein